MHPLGEGGNLGLHQSSFKFSVMQSLSPLLDDIEDLLERQI